MDDRPTPDRAGGRILAAAREDWEGRRGDLVKIDVPEWTDPKTGVATAIYFYPTITVSEKRAMFKHLKQTTDAGFDYDLYITALIVRARDESGGRMFSNLDRKRFEEIDPNVLERIVTEMGGITAKSIDDAVMKTGT